MIDDDDDIPIVVVILPPNILILLLHLHFHLPSPIWWDYWRAVGEDRVIIVRRRRR